VQSAEARMLADHSRVTGIPTASGQAAPQADHALARRASAAATGWPSWRGFLTRAFHPDRLIIPREPPANPRQLRIHPHRDDRAREREHPSEALLREAP